jgi:hypothetical protein
MEAGLAYPTFIVTYKVGADDVKATAFASTNLQSWSNLSADVVVRSHTSNGKGNGNATVKWRSTRSITEALRQFFRLRATNP